MAVNIWSFTRILRAIAGIWDNSFIDVMLYEINSEEQWKDSFLGMQ